jgi:hypothetical protein
MKWLIVLVLPGLTDVLASLDHPVSKLISEDLPTLDLPMNPNSGFAEEGQSLRVGLLLTNVAE